MKPALKERGFKPNAATVAPIIFPGVNGCAVCDCGCTSFRVGMGVDEVGNNRIHCLECIVCQKQLAVPYFHNGATVR
jgi:hypothetical protein